MAASIFKRKNEPSLFKIIVILVAILGAAYGVYRGSKWFTGDYVAGTVEAAAPETIETARQLIAAGDLQKAKTTLSPLIARAQDPAVAVPALLLMAKVTEQTDTPEAALPLLRRAVNDFPSNPHSMEATLVYAESLERTGALEDAYTQYARVRDGAPPELQAGALVAFGRKAAIEGNEQEALSLYRQTLAQADWNSRAYLDALDALGALNIKHIFSVEETPGCKYYEVKPGDSLTSIGVALNTTQGLLLRANGLDSPNTLRVGQRLKYTPKDFRIVIERSSCRVFLCDAEGPFKMYRAGLGKPGSETVLGQYKIGSKQQDPVWYPPTGGVIEAGDPRNQLGTRWMPMVPLTEGLPSDLGIHGAVDPSTVGTYSSNGCARMLMPEVEELYDLVVRSTPVDVVENATKELLG